MGYAMLEQEIFQDAIKAFKKENNIEIDDINLQTIHQQKPDAGIDLRLQNNQIKLNIQIKANTNNTNLANIANQMQKIDRPALLVTRYVNPLIAKKLRDLDINFIDTAGNAYINMPTIYIWVTGKKTDCAHVQYNKNVAWGPAKLKILFALLCHANLIDENYRTIAIIANTALGTVNWTIRDLIKKGYVIVKNTKKRKLVDKKKLLDRWVENYIEKLRPQTLLGQYKAKVDIAIKQLNIIEYNAQWGGETAAAEITDYLRPGIFTIYTDKTTMNNIIYQLKLDKTPGGNVELRQKYWGNDPIWGNKKTVHPILAYADLMATAELRNIETAGIIYDQYILRHLGQD